MVNEELKKKMKSRGSTEAVILALEERGFCVGLKKDGKAHKSESRKIMDFMPTINECEVSWVDFVVDDLEKEGPALAHSLGFSDNLVKILLKNLRGGYEDFDTEMGMLLPAIVVQGFDVSLNPLLVLVKKNLVFTIHTKEVKRFFRLRRYAEVFMGKLKPNLIPEDKISMMLLRIIDENNTRNFDHLREIEENADKLSEKLADPTSPRSVIGKDIHLMKHALITYLAGLWSTLDVLNGLRYGDAALLTNNQKILDRLVGVVEEVQTHIGLAEHLSAVLASGLEVLQSIYNNQLQVLNNKLALLVAYLTIIGTAVLVPNTLATALSSDIFQLGPKDQSWYIALMVGSTIISTIAAYLFVMRAGLLPKKVD
jgi:magnesium transporter